MVNRRIIRTPKAMNAYLRSPSPKKEKVATTTLRKGVNIITKIPKLITAAGSPLIRWEISSENSGLAKSPGFESDGVRKNKIPRPKISSPAAQ